MLKETLQHSNHSIQFVQQYWTIYKR